MQTSQREQTGTAVRRAAARRANAVIRRSLAARGETLAAALLLAAAAAVLYLGGNTAGSLVTAGTLAAALLVCGAAVGVSRERNGLSREEQRRLMCFVYGGVLPGTGLALSPLVRLVPPALAAAAAGAYLLRAAVGGGLDGGTAAAVLAVFCAAATVGGPLPGLIAAAGGVQGLKQKDVVVRDAEKLAASAAVGAVLADKSVFFAAKGTEIGGVYLMGKARGVSELGFSDATTLLTAINVCDDGALSAAFGFRQSILDGLLRSLRTTRMEHGEIFGAQTTDFLPYDSAVGFARATCVSRGGEVCTYYVGKPELFLGELKSELTPEGSRALNEADLKRIRVHLRQTYSAGREIIAAARGAGEGRGLELIGFLHVNFVVSESAVESVGQLHRVGVTPVYVSEENENCAFYHARELGVARDMSQVLTGARIDRFRPENLERAARHARLCAEAGPAHRRVLTRLVGAERRFLAASKFPDDALLEGADVRVTAEGGAFSTDITGRSCSIEEVSWIVRTARSVCAVARRAEMTLFTPSIAALLLCFVTAALFGAVPFGAAAAAVLAVLAPLPQTLLTAGMDTRPGKTSVFRIVSSEADGDGMPLRAGFGLAAWNVGWWLAAAAASAAVFRALAGTDEAGQTVFGAAAGAGAFLTLLSFSLAHGLVCRVWGRPLTSLKDERGGWGFLIATVLVWLVFYGVLRIPAAAGALGLAAVPYRKLVVTLIPAAAELAVYLVGGLIRRRRKDKDRK